MKAVKEHLQKSDPDSVASFEKGATDFAKKVVAKFKDFEFVRVDYLHWRNVHDALLVHWGINESRWHGCASELQGELMSGLLGHWS